MLVANPAAFEYDSAAFEAAVIFVVVDGGCTLVDAVFTFGKKGFRIDSAGIKCLSVGWIFVSVAELDDVSNVGALDVLFGCWLLVNKELLTVFCLEKLTAVARSLPPPMIIY